MTAFLGVAAVAQAEPAVEIAPADATTAPPAESPATSEAPMNAAATARYEKGLELYEKRNFRAAIEEFEEGFAVEPRREFLFAEAQAYRLAGDCAHAVPLFNRFLATQPSAIQIDATRLALERCAHQAPLPPVVEPRAPDLRPLPQPPLPIPAPPPAPPWWRDPWGLTAVGAGVVAAGVGGGFLLASNRSWDAAHASTVTLAPTFDRQIANYESRHKVAVASFATSAALGAAAAVRFAYVAYRNRTTEEKSEPALIALYPLSHGAALVWSGDF